MYLTYVVEVLNRVVSFEEGRNVFEADVSDGGSVGYDT